MKTITALIHLQTQHVFVKLHPIGNSYILMTVIYAFWLSLGKDTQIHTFTTQGAVSLTRVSECELARG